MDDAKVKMKVPRAPKADDLAPSKSSRPVT